MKKLTTEEFIQRAIRAHGDKYDYSKVDYSNSRTKVCIICPKHGEFWQLANAHLMCQNCPKCTGNYSPSTAEFVRGVRKIHNNKYDYSKVDYINNVTKVCIICPHHGEFYQKPMHHSEGQGCPKCTGNYSPSTQEFIQRVRKIHNNKYDYTKVDYVTSKIKVCIICPKHGVFWQRPNNHLSGQECPICKESKGEKYVVSWLDEYDIAYVREKIFNECRNINPLPFDFYLPNYNTLIEYDGEQHFKPIDHFGGIIRFKKQQKHDDIKNKYCKDNNIQLIRISYLESIEERLSASLLN